MNSSTIIILTCFSGDVSLQVPASIVDDLLTLEFNGEGETTLVGHIVCFLEFNTEHNIQCKDVACRLFILTFEGSIRKWCQTLTDASIHSFKHLVTKLSHAFDMFDCKCLRKKILELRKSPDEPLHHFHIHFMHLCFEYLKDEADWNFLIRIFQYLIHISENLHELEYFELLPKYLGVRASKFSTGNVVVPCDPLSSSHQTTLVL